MTQSTPITTPRRPRLRILALIQGLVIVASLLAPLTAFAAITSVSVSGQVPDPVAAGNSAVYIVTVQHSAGNATLVTGIAGLPAGATFTSGCSTASPATLTVTISTTLATPAGTFTFTPTVAERNNGVCNNNSGTTNSSATGTLVVGKVNQTITFPGLADVRFDQAAPVPGASASSLLPVTYSTASAGICSVTSGGVITLVGVGSCTIAADQAGNATYNPAPQQSQSFTITPGNQTITFGALAPKTLADSPVTVGATAASGLAVSFSSTTPLVCTVSGTSVTLLTTGSCTIAADQAGNANWNAAPQVLQSFTVSAAPKTDQTITFPALAGVRLDQAAPVPGATASSSLPVTYSTASAGICSVTSGGVITLLGVGSCTIAADQAGNATYNPAPQQSQSFTITPGNQTITFGALAPKTLADSPVTVGATAASGLAVSFSSTTPLVCTVSGTSVTLLTTGSCTIAADQAGNANWNAAPQVLQSFTVSAAPKTDQTITFPALAGVRLDQAAPVPGATASSSLPVTYSTASAGICSVTSGGVITLLGVGSCTIAADQAGNATYNPAPQQSQSFTITPGNQTITFGALAPKTLADSPVTVGATAASGLAVSFSSTTPLVCTVSGTSVTLLTTGSCTIAADQAGNANWNAAPQVLQSFTVSAAPKTDQTITFPALAGVRLDQAAPVPGATASSSLPVTYSTASAGICSVTSGGVITLLGVGSCTIAADQAGNATYNPAPQQSQSFTITPGNQTITFGALAPKTLADSPVTVGATAASGLAVSFSSTTPLVCTVSGTSVTLLTTGSCTIAADQAGNANWNAAPQVLQSFTVSAAPITPSLILNKTTVPQGGTVLVTGQGYMPDDSVDVYLNSTPVLLAQAVPTDGSGAFSVTVTIPMATVVGAHTIEGLGLDPNGAPLSLTAPITVTAAAVQPATDTTPTAPAAKDLDPLPIGILLLLFLILTGVAIALADPRSARKQR